MDKLQSLTDINLDDLVSSFGWEHHLQLSRVLRFIFANTARRFASQMLEFDEAVGRLGLVEGGRQTIRRYVHSLRLFSPPLPNTPILALSNHPGMMDTLALFAALDRPDLKIIAIERPFLKSLTYTSKQLVYLKEDPLVRMALIRKVSEHLRSGGSALTFPAGKIEPDANVYPGAFEALANWTDSASVFIRMAPETAILPVLVRGVIWEKTAQHPLTRLRKTKEEQEKFAAALQLLAHVVWNMKSLDVSVQIGNPITIHHLGSRDTSVIHQAVLKEMRRLIENPPQGKGNSLL